MDFFKVQALVFIRVATYKYSKKVDYKSKCGSSKVKIKADVDKIDFAIQSVKWEKVRYCILVKVMNIKYPTYFAKVKQIYFI